jgi:protease-4
MEKKHPGALRRVFGALWALLDGLRRALLNLLLLLVIIVIAVGLFSKETLPVPAGGALIVNPSGELVDQLSYVDPLSGIVSGSGEPSETLLSDVVKAIDTAATDKRIKMIVLQTDALQHGGLSKLEELAAALARFRARGKTVVAVGDSFNQDQYWPAAQADKVFMNPMGEVLLQGYGVYTNFFKSALDKLQVNMHIFRVGTYKSAVEPFMRDDMSAAVKENHLTWLGALWKQYRDGIASRRGVAPATIDEYIDKIDTVFAAQQGDTGKAALAWHLVDGLKSREEANDWLVEQVGQDDKGYFRGIEMRDYLAANRHLIASGSSADKIGIIVASGVILDGEQRAGQVGGDTVAALIRQARLDDHIKALVLRIDSEGGSAFAAEIIRQQLAAFQETGKPLVVSMGSIAASGGYWIAAGADEVWATPGTITGSIGIFGAFPTFENSLAKLGVHTDGVGTTARAGSLRVDRPLDPVVARAIQSSIDAGYRRFLQIVADGRDMKVEDVDRIAQGQVWAGSDAVKIGLVDKLGSLQDAVKAAASLAQLEHYDTQLIAPPVTAPELLLQKLAGASADLMPRPSAAARLFAAATTSQSPLGPLLREMQKMMSWNDPKATYLFCGGCARL